MGSLSRTVTWASFYAGTGGNMYGNIHKNIFPKAKNWKQCKKKKKVRLWHTHTMEYDKAANMNEPMLICQHQSQNNVE